MIPRAVREGSQRSKSKTWGVVSWEGSTRHACCHVETLRIVHKGRCIAVGKSAVVVTWVADASGHMDVLWTSLIVCTQTFFGFWPKQHLSFASLSHGLHRNYIQQTLGISALYQSDSIHSIFLAIELFSILEDRAQI